MLNHAPNTRGIVVAFAACLLLGANTAAAVPLGLTLGVPDIQASGVLLSYDPIDNQLSLAGEVDLVSYDDLTSVVVSGDFALVAAMDPYGVFSGGSFTMFDGATLLLSGELTAFGSSISSLEFLYDVTGGTLGAGYDVGGLLLNGGLRSDDVLLTANAGALASNPVPEPSAALLFLIGGVTIAVQTRRHD